MDGAAVILAGGASERMGQEKALLSLGGETLIERALRQLAPRFCETILSVAAAGASSALALAVKRFERESGHTVRLVEDRFANGGPLAGIDAALNATEHSAVFVIAVDLPGIFLPLVERLWAAAEEPDVLGCVPSFGGRTHPTYAAYRREILAAVSEQRERGVLRAQALAEISGVRVLDLDSPCLQAELLGDVPPGKREAVLQGVFRNLNSPADYDLWRELNRGSES